MNSRKIIKNAAWIIICKVIEAIISLVIGMLTARYLGPANYGLINYASSIVAFVAPIMQLGITSILVQELVNNQDEEGEILGTSMFLCFLSSLVCIAGIMTFVSVSDVGEKNTILVCALYSTLLIFQSVECTKYWFQANLKAKYSSLATLLVFLILSLYKVFLLATNKSVVWFSTSAPLDYLFMAIVLVFLYKKLNGKKLSISLKTGKRLLNKGKYYIIPTMMVSIFGQTDKIMLKAMINTEVTGFYSAAITCAGLTGFVFLAILDSFRPAIFESQKLGQDVFEENVSKLYCIIFYLSLLQSIIMTLFAPLLINILFGKDYAASIPCLRIAVWYTTFSYFGAIRNIWMLAENKQRYLWIINLSGALANVLLNAVLIPIFAEKGAAVASLITQVFANVILGFIIRPIKRNNTLMIKGLSLRYLKLLTSVHFKRGQPNE